MKGYAGKLLPALAIYGANASGKSNVLSAISFMTSAVNLSHRVWDPDAGVPRDTFALGSSGRDSSLFEVQFLAEGVRYQYGFVADDDGFEEEWLFAWPKGKKQVWFERDGEDFKFGENFHGENKLVQRTTRANALFLSTAIQHAHGQLRPVYRWFRRFDFVSGGRPSPRARYGPTELWLARLMDERTDPQQVALFSDLEEDADFSAFLRLMRVADFGITDVRADASAGDGDRRRFMRRPRIMLKHQTSDDERGWLPLEEESHGTRTLFGLALPLIYTLRSGGLLAVDELEAGLHPLLAAYIVEQFNGRDTNPNGAQILFTTHDTNLLGSTVGDALLRRDQVWLTEKDPEGSTNLFPLSDFQVRKSENLERGYLQGRYGAIPMLRKIVLPEGG